MVCEAVAVVVIALFLLFFGFYFRERGEGAACFYFSALLAFEVWEIRFFSFG